MAPTAYDGGSDFSPGQTDSPPNTSSSTSSSHRNKGLNHQKTIIFQPNDAKRSGVPTGKHKKAAATAPTAATHLPTTQSSKPALPATSHTHPTTSSTPTASTTPTISAEQNNKMVIESKTRNETTNNNDNARANDVEYDKPTITTTTTNDNDNDVDGFVQVRRKLHFNGDNPNDVIIESSQECQWIILDIPILTTAEPTTYAPYIADALSTGCDIDTTFSFIHTDIPQESLAGTTRRDTIRNDDLYPRPPRERKLKQFIRKPSFRPAPENLQLIGVQWMCRFEANVFAKDTPLLELTNQLNTLFDTHGGRAVFHQINESVPSKVGVLLYSSNQLNRAELELAIAEATSIPVNTRLVNLTREINCTTKPTKKTKKSTSNVILVETSSNDVEDMTEFLSSAYPVQQRETSASYITFRKMTFLPWSDIESVTTDTNNTNETTSNTTTMSQLVHHSIMEHHKFCKEITFKEIRFLRPLDTKITIATDECISLKHALSTFCRPYANGQKPPAISSELILDSSQPDPSDPDIIRLTYYKSNRSHLNILIQNLDRAFEIHFGDGSLVRQALSPRVARSWKSSPHLLHQWSDNDATELPSDEEEINDSERTTETATGGQDPGSPRRTSPKRSPRSGRGYGNDSSGRGGGQYKKQKLGTPTKQTPLPQTKNSEAKAAPRQLNFLLSDNSISTVSQPTTTSTSYSSAVTRLQPNGVARRPKQFVVSNNPTINDTIAAVGHMFAEQQRTTDRQRELHRQQDLEREDARNRREEAREAARDRREEQRLLEQRARDDLRDAQMAQLNQMMSTLTALALQSGSTGQSNNNQTASSSSDQPTSELQNHQGQPPAQVDMECDHNQSESAHNHQQHDQK